MVLELGEPLCQCWQRHGGSADPAASFPGQRHTKPVLSLAFGAGQDPNIWPWRVSPASAEAAGAGEQLVGGKEPFLPFRLLEKGALSSFRVFPIRLFSCLSSRG